jgi:hypothetical protein
MKRLTPALMLLAVAGPAVAHEGHGEPGLLHGFSGEHGIALLAAIGLMVAGVALARPVMRLIARARSRR